MVGALGVNQAWLFTSVFALGALLAGLGGALQLPRQRGQLARGAQDAAARLGGMHGGQRHAAAQGQGVGERLAACERSGHGNLLRPKGPPVSGPAGGGGIRDIAMTRISCCTNFV
jgi:hypothetical protein